MRIRTAAAAAVLLLAALTACGGSDEPAAKPKPTRTASPEDKFVAALAEADIPSWKDNAPSYNELHAYPPKWCAALDEGHSVEYLFGESGLYPVGQEWGTKKTDAYKVLVLGVTAFCPEHRKQVTEELRESGDY